MKKAQTSKIPSSAFATIAILSLLISQFLFAGYVLAETPEETVAELYRRTDFLATEVSLLESGKNGEKVDILRTELHTIRDTGKQIAQSLSPVTEPAGPATPVPEKPPAPDNGGAGVNQPPLSLPPASQPPATPDTGHEAPATQQDFSGLLGKISSALNLITSFIVGLAVFVIIWGIFTYLTHAAEEEKRTEARQFIVYGIIGVFLMLSIWGFVNILLNTFHLDTVINKESIPVVPRISS